MTRIEELQADLENLIFNCRYLIGVLAELEQLGRMHTEEFKRVEKNLNVLRNNIKRIEAEIEKEETNLFEATYFSAGCVGRR